MIYYQPPTPWDLIRLAAALIVVVAVLCWIAELIIETAGG